MDKSLRKNIINIIDQHSIYDAASVIIKSDGSISARRDPDKTYQRETIRYNIGHVSDYDMGRNPFADYQKT